jgi:hypothetical protein
MTEKLLNIILLKSGSYLDGSCRGGKCTFISATNKENFEEFRERVYEAVRHIHITRFPTISSCIQITKMPSKRRQRRRRNRVIFFTT